MRTTPQQLPAVPGSMPRARRRWWQFSVRTMLLLVALVAITAGTVIPWVRSSLAQRNFVATNGSQLRVEVVYHRPADPLNPITAWFVDKLGPDFVWPLKEVRALGRAKDLRLETVDLSKLEILELRDPLSFDWNLLRRMPQLQELSIYGLEAQGFEDISYCTHLKKLLISRAEISDFSQLEQLEQLEELYLGSCKIYELAPISKLKKLSKLSLGNNPAVDFSPLAKCDQLKELSIFMMKFDKKMFLSNCIHLRKLRLSHTNYQDIRPLIHLPQLQELDIGGTEVTDLKAVANCANLKSLDCSYTSISDMTPLRNCGQLESLNIIGTRVTDISALTEIKSLRWLGLSQALCDQFGQQQLKQLFPDCVLVPPPVSEQ